MAASRLATLVLLAAHASAYPLPTQLLTLTVPNGTETYNHDGLICTPALWNDILMFFFVNYVSHLATMRTSPSETWSWVVGWYLWALFTPFMGITLNTEVLFRFPVFAKTNLQKAALSDALVVVVRSRDWQPFHGEGEIRDVNMKLEEGGKRHRRCAASLDTIDSLDTDSTSLKSISYSVKITEGSHNNTVHPHQVHGLQVLPAGYALCSLSHTAQVQDSAEGDRPNVVIACHYNLLKIAAATFQVLFASLTVWRTRGDQLERWGYASFGLTVIPFVLMSLVNLATHLFTPSYPALYLVSSPELKEAEGRGGIFSGVVGTVLEDTPSATLNPTSSSTFSGSFAITPHHTSSFHRKGSTPSIYAISPTSPSTLLIPSHSRFRSNATSTFQRYAPWAAAYSLLAITVVAVWALTRFRAGRSTAVQRVAVAAWVGSNAVALLLPFLRVLPDVHWACRCVLVGAVMVGPVAGTAGFYVVGGMLMELGKCERLQ